MKIKFKFWFLILNFGIFCEKKVQKFENQVQNLIFDCEFWHLLLRTQVTKIVKNKFFTSKWIGRVLASLFLVLQLSDFLMFCFLVLIEKCAQNIAKSSWKIWEGAFYIFCILLWESAKNLKIKNLDKMNCFTFKWIRRVLSSPFLVLQLFDFLIFCCLLLRKQRVQKIGKSSCQIRGGGARAFPGIRSHDLMHLRQASYR